MVNYRTTGDKYGIQYFWHNANRWRHGNRYVSGWSNNLRHWSYCKQHNHGIWDRNGWGGNLYGKSIPDSFIYGNQRKPYI